MADISDPQRLLQVFLCHSSSDKETVRNLYRRLRSDGIAAWLDEEDLLPGQDWHLEIKKAITTADAVLICLSCESISKSGFVQKEIKYALDVADQQPEGSIFIVPIKLEECDVPDRLSRLQWLDLTDRKGYERLINALRHRANSLGIKTRDKSAGELDIIRPCQVLDSIRTVKELFDNSLSQRGIRLEVRIDPFLAVDIPLHLLSLALANLVANAKDALNSGGTIRIETEEVGNLVYCHVIDNGPGIPLSVRDNVFDLGFTTKRTSGGWGLYLSSRALREYRGELVLADTSSKGTKFTIRVPKPA